MLKQLPLPLIPLPEDETFASFYSGNNAISNNAMALYALKTLLASSDFSYIFLFGASNTGKSHLLHSSCAQVSAEDQSMALLPMQQLVYLSSELLDGLEHLSLVCIDNIEHIAGNSEWEVAIFDLFNRIREQNQCRLIITANASPTQLNIKLPDLVSRLSWGQTYQLQQLSDEEKLCALQQRALQRGFELPIDVAQFLVKRVERDLIALFELLNKLDRATLEEKRKLTVPFVKQVLMM